MISGRLGLSTTCNSLSRCWSLERGVPCKLRQGFAPQEEMLAEENIWSAGFDYLISPAADISG